MSLSFSVFKPRFKKTIAEAVYNEVVSGTSIYYHWLGKENLWTDFLSPFIGSSAGDYPGQPSNNFRYDLHVKRDILTLKKIKPSDVSFVINRIDWVEGQVYDMYDDAIETVTGYGFAPSYSGAVTLEDSLFYVLTSEFKVYKCIWNANNKPSTIMPTSTSTKVVTTSDGYKWKFMYSIPVSLRNRFLTPEWMPVATALKSQYYSSGEVRSIAIQNGGGGYGRTTTTAAISGDGYQEINPYALTEILVETPLFGTIGGSGYLVKAGNLVPGDEYQILTFKDSLFSGFISDRGTSTGTVLTVSDITTGTYGGLIDVNQELIGTTSTLALSNVQITSTGGEFSCDTTALTVGQKVDITGTLASGATGVITAGTYYIIATNGTTTFTLSTFANGTAASTTAGTTTGLTFTKTVESIPTTKLSNVKITGTGGTFTCDAATLTVGQTIVITGTFAAGSITSYSSGNTYYIIATNGSSTFTLSASYGGTAVTTTSSSGSVTGATYAKNTLVVNQRATAVATLAANSALVTLASTDGKIVPGMAVTGPASTTLSTVTIFNASGVFQCDTTTLAVGQSVTISGTLASGATGAISGYSNPTTYYITSTNGTNSFTLSTSLGGSSVTTTAGSVTGLTFTVSYIPAGTRVLYIDNVVGTVTLSTTARGPLTGAALTFIGTKAISKTNYSGTTMAAASSAWSSGGSATLNAYYYAGTAGSYRYYQCTAAGTFTTTAPSHTSGSTTNGTATLAFICSQGALPYTLVTRSAMIGTPLVGMEVTGSAAIKAGTTITAVNGTSPNFYLTFAASQTITTATWVDNSYIELNNGFEGRAGTYTVDTSALTASGVVIGTDNYTTDFTAVGAGVNAEGTIFTASAVGAGNGTAFKIVRSTVAEPFPSATEWVSSGTVSRGQYIKNTTGGFTYYYEVISGTSVGTNPPTHTSITAGRGDTVSYTAGGGNVEFKYVGKRALLNSAIMNGDSDSVVQVVISDVGKGYKGKPDLTFTPPFTHSAIWKPAFAGDSLGNIIKHEDRYYRVMGTGTTIAADGPSHVSGTALNGSVAYKFIGQDPKLSASVTKTEAAISLIISPPKDSIFKLSLNYGGKKYVEVPTITIDPPPGGGSTATATAVLGTGAYVGQVFTTEIIEVGNGYTSTPTVTISKPQITISSQLFAVDGNLNYTTDIITYKSGAAAANHRLETGDAVVYNNGGGTSIGGLTSGTIYYIIRVDATSFKLATTRANAISTTAINLTTPGSFSTGHTFTLLADIGNSIATSTVNSASSGSTTLTATTAIGSITIQAGMQVAGSTNIPLGTYVTAVSGTSISLSKATTGVISNASLTFTATGPEDAKATAVLGSGGEIVGYTIDDYGTGYTNATITVNDTSQNALWNTNNTGGAILIADFDVGSVETLQADVELLAVPGSVEVVKMVNNGTGYSVATVEILGDGTGATAVATCSGGQVTHIEIVTTGSGYTWTDIIIKGNAGASGAEARAIMSPQDGHGANALEELNAHSLSFFTSISRDVNQGIEIINDYRKLGLVRNIKKFGSNQRFSEDIGSGCVLIEGTFNKLNLLPDMLLIKDGYKKYRIVEFNDTQILLSVFNNFTLAPGDTLETDPTNLGTITDPDLQKPQMTITVRSVKERTIDQFSGDFLFFSVRESFAPTPEQIVTARTTLTI